MIDNIIEELKSDSESNYNIRISQKNTPDPIYNMIEKIFLKQDNLEVERIKSADFDKIDIIKDSSVIHSSSVDKIRDSILMTNSDEYITKRDQFDDIEFPDSILKLTGESFYLRGYPKAYNEKLILISISRYIEKLSYDNGGKHYATFQNIGRLNDEIGTYNIYKSLSNKVDSLNLYGLPSDNMRSIIDDIDANYNIGDSEPHRRLWVVIHISEEHTAALAALENEEKENEWTAIWTFNRDDVLQLEKTMNKYF